MRMNWMVAGLVCSVVAFQIHAAQINVPEYEESAYSSLQDVRAKAAEGDHVKVHGVIKKYNGEGIMEIVDGTGSMNVYVPLELLSGNTPQTGRHVYLDARVVHSPFEPVRLDVDKINFGMCKEKAEVDEKVGEIMKK